MRDQLERFVQDLLDKGIRYEEARREFERCFIARALARSGGSLGRTAHLLGIHRNTLARKLDAYRLARKR